MLQYIYNKVKAERPTVLLSCVAALAGMTTACQDDWDQHYAPEPSSPTASQSIYEIISSRSDLSDFRAVLDAARLYANDTISQTYYSQLLNGNQFFTVCAPVNGTFNRDSLLALCQTDRGDSLVELHFLRNHIARYGHSVVSGSTEQIKLFNGKSLMMQGTTYGDATITESNIPSRNGILHVLATPATYRYNIYEALLSLPQYQHIGNFLHSYQIREFDEVHSLASGVKDGKTEYADKVYYTWNRLLQENLYGHLDSEDSTYWMLVPDQSAWKELYAEASSYYNYGPIAKADSIHEYWTNYALLQDLVFNPHTQLSQNDSLCATTWNSREAGRHHVYYKPFETGGLMSYSDASLTCSNGTIYELASWPEQFEKTHTYFRNLWVQGEGRIYDSFEAKGKTLKTERRTVSADTISDNGYLCITPQTLYDPYYVIYEVPNVLSGTYDVCAVILPKTVYNPNYSPTTDKKQFYPNKFIAEVFYAGTDGQTKSVKSSKRYKIDESDPAYYVEASNTDTSVPFLFNCNFDETKAATRAFKNDPYRVDTICLATIKFPTCNYDQQKVTTRVKLTNNITNKQTTQYSAEIFLDCILFRPHVETE